MSKESEYFALVVNQFMDWQIGAATALPKAPENEDARLIYTRAKLAAAQEIAHVNIHYNYLFGEPKEALGGDILTENTKNNFYRLLDSNRKGTLESHLVSGDEYTVSKETVGTYTHAMLDASAVLTVLDGFDKGKRATQEEIDKAKSQESARLVKKYAGGDVKKYNKGGFDHDYDDASTQRINLLSGDVSNAPILPKNFKAPGLMAMPTPTKPAAPKPTAPAGSTENITFTATESPSSRAYNATFGFEDSARDKGRGIIKGKFHANGVDVDLGSEDFKKKVRAIYDKYHAAFDTGTDQKRSDIIVALSKEYAAHTKDKTTGGAEYLTALGIFNDAKDIRDLQKASPPQLETPRWTNWKEFRKNAEMLHFDLKEEYAPNTTVTQLHKNIDVIEAADLELNGHIITSAGSINYIKVRDRMPDLENSADLSAVVEPYKKAWGTGLTAQDTARRKEVFAELYDKYAKATSDEDKALYKHAIGSLGRSITHLSGLAKGMKAIPAYPTVAAYEADEQKSLAYAKSAYDAKQKGVTAPEETPAAPAADTSAPAEDASTPAAKPKPAPKPKLKAGAEVKVQSGDSLSKLALRSDELMNVALELAKKGEIEGLTADASKRAVAGWIAGVIAKQSGIDDANVVTVGQKVKLPTADELKAAAKPPAPVVPPVKEPTQAEKEAAAKQRAAEEEKAQKDAEKLRQQQAEQEQKNKEELKQKEAELDLKNRTVSDIRKYQALVDVVNLGGSRQNAIGDMVKKMKEYGLNGADDKQSLERAAAILLAASNGLENGASRTMSTSLLVPTDEQIQAGVKALNETVASKNSKGGRLLKRGDGEEITPGELKASIPESVKKAVKGQATGK